MYAGYGIHYPCKQNNKTVTKKALKCSYTIRRKKLLVLYDNCDHRYHFYLFLRVLVTMLAVSYVYENYQYTTKIGKYCVAFVVN